MRAVSQMFGERPALPGPAKGAQTPVCLACKLVPAQTVQTPVCRSLAATCSLSLAACNIFKQRPAAPESAQNKRVMIWNDLATPEGARLTRLAAHPNCSFWSSEAPAHSW